MKILLVSIHVVAAFVLILVVLLQHGKGADIGAAFGGGASQTVFGSRGAGNFLTKMTTLFVVLFMITSMSLAYLSTPRSVLDGVEGQESAPTSVPETLPDATPIEPEAASGADDDVLPEGFEAIPATGNDSAPSAESDTAQDTEPTGGAPEDAPAPPAP